tara:strand:- start:1375 stop:1953 length:579 start_codon:yes stop_codon:yes gene_type:complete
MSLIKIFKKINDIFSFLKPKNRTFFYLDHRKKFKKLYLTNQIYSEKNTDICEINFEKIKEKDLKKYKLIIISKEINYCSNKTIKKIINFLIKNKKDVIIEGYSCYFNLNLDNYCNWFRPLDVTKEPFNYKKKKILYYNISLNYLIQYLILILLLILVNFKNNSFLNLILFFSTLIILFFIPFKKIIQLENIK